MKSYMHRILLITTFLILIFSVQRTVLAKVDPTKYPSYEEVVQKFCASYQDKLQKGADKTVYIHFVKDNEGWKVDGSEEYGNPPVAQGELFWSYKKGDYNNLETIRKGRCNSETYLNSSYIFNYNVNVFYGYVSYYDDVIQHCASKKVLSEFELRSLARSYSLKADAVLNMDWSVSVSGSKEEKILTPEVIESYMKVRNKSLKAFKELEQRNPELETIVGKVGRKWANEHVNAAYQLFMRGFNKEAEHYLIKGLYQGDPILDHAKNLLNSCAKNAILYTGGDNDSFPLWYVQLTEGFRRDVRVCNLSYLNVDVYVDMLKRDFLDSKALPISLEREVYRNGGLNDYIPYYAKSAVVKMDLQRFIEVVSKKENPLQFTTVAGTIVNTFPTKNFVWKLDSNALIQMDFIAEDQKKFVRGEHNWTYGRRGIEKKHLIMMEIMTQNNFERPIYYSTTVSSMEYMGLNSNMQLEGLCVRLMPFEVVKDQNVYVRTDITYENMMNKFVCGNFNSGTSQFNSNTRAKFNMLAQALYDEGKREKCLNVLNRSAACISDKVHPYDYSVATRIKLLIELGKLDEANIILKTMNSRIKLEMDGFLKQTPQRLDDDYDDFKRKLRQNIYLLSEFEKVKRTEPGLDAEVTNASEMLKYYLEQRAFQSL